MFSYDIKNNENLFEAQTVSGMKPLQALDHRASAYKLTRFWGELRLKEEPLQILIVPGHLFPPPVDTTLRLRIRTGHRQSQFPHNRHVFRAPVLPHPAVILSKRHIKHIL